MVGPNGVTVRSSGTQGNTAISGFYGANSKSSSTSLAAWLCQTRPWASGFFSRIISASYFDNLCIKRGYQVGSLPTTPTASKTTQSVSSKTTQNPPIKVSTTTRATTTVIVSTSTVPVIPPKVQIWAVPPTVPIGSRTSVFWNTRGVKGCIVTSPDGSFYQTSLSGGASTVPLTTATTYTISCLAPDGTPVTDYFTVRMAI